MEEQLGKQIVQLRLNNNLTEKELSDLCSIAPSTLSRYENGHFKIQLIDLNILKNISVHCGKNPLFLFNDYLLFRLYHKEILSQYLEAHSTSKYNLSEQLGVSYQLVKSWFRYEKRCPSLELWRATFTEITSYWINHNIDSINR